MSEPVTIIIEGVLFQAAKQAFQDRYKLELADQEFLDRRHLYTAQQQNWKK